MGTTRKLLFNSSIVFIGTFLGGIFSYLFNMLMGRQLGPVYYGEMTAIMSLLMIASVAGGAIFTISMRYSGELQAAGEQTALKKLFGFLSKYVLAFAASIFVIGALLSKPLADFFSISSVLPVIIGLSSVVLGLLIMVNRGFLQGTQKFLAVSTIGAAEMLIRLVLGVTLVAFGLSLNGALIAIVLSTATVFFVSFWPLRKIFSVKGQKNDSIFKFDKKEIINYSWPTFIAAALLVISLSLDIILVKHFFPPKEAGLYAAISTIAKIILYATSPIIGVMFPMVSEQKTKGEKHYRVFLFSLMITMIAALCILAIYTIIPGKVISILYGRSYVDYYYLLPEMGLAITFYSLLNLIANYYLAIKNFIFLWFFGLILVVQIIAISLWHPSLEAVVRVFIFSFGALFVLMFGYYLFLKWQPISQYLRDSKGSLHG